MTLLPEGFTSARPIAFPCMAARLVPAWQVVANEYNPNKVASPEMALLADSIAADGVTQPIVVVHDGTLDRYIVVDGFHRHSLLKNRFGCEMIPVVVLDKPLGARMASTIRHNRARGSHQVPLMAALVRSLEQEGLADAGIAGALGMEAEEVLRLRQHGGTAPGITK